MLTESRLETFNTAEPAVAEGELLACCAARSWADELIVRRPYHDVATLLSVSDAIFAELPWAGVEQALAAHPRIGERAQGEGREAAWSREEQAGVSGAGEELREANLEYERRFGRVFLVCATGLSAEQVLANLRARLGNDEEAERAAVREELRKIVSLRLRKLVGA